MLELWAGAECSVVRVGSGYVDQLERTAHASRLDDLDRLAKLGVRAFRQAVLWERAARGRAAGYDWGWSDERLQRLRELGVRPIVGLVHHGSGPAHTNLLAPSFAEGLAAFARSVVERYPWVKDFTPVNEPLTTARFSGLYGHWYPHERSDRAFVRALLNQCFAIRAAMRAIREVQPEARLVQTEDFGTVFATARLAYQARFENARRFLSLDLLMGRVDRAHRMWTWLVNAAGAFERELDDLVANPAPPDTIGVNYYVTSDRLLDERIAQYPPGTRGGNGKDQYADVEAVRVRARGIVGHEGVLRFVAARYLRPVAITEAHLAGPAEEQIRWLMEAWRGAERARARGVDVRAVTLWSAFGAYDWDSLLASRQNRYEAGAYDVRGPQVRATALACVARDLGARGRSDHPLVAGEGWWARGSRLLYPPVGPRAEPQSARPTRPVLVVGARGTLGSAIERICKERSIAVFALSRKDLDASDADAVGRALGSLRPWALVNAAGFVRVDEAECAGESCWHANVLIAETLAYACRSRGVRYATFSSDLVFDGALRRPYVETDTVAPLSVYGRSKVEAEARVLEAYPEALVVRTSAFFGPWDGVNFVARTLGLLERGASVRAASDALVSPTYVPDLCHAVVTLLVDGAGGVWHLANVGVLSWFDLAEQAARLAGLDAASLLRPCMTAELGLSARRPLFSALSSRRAAIMPGLEDALARFVAERSAARRAA